MDQSAIHNSKFKIVVIGVGNEYRSDDAVGLIAARHLRGKATDQIAVLEHGGEAGSLIEVWKDANAAIVIDAVHSGANPGTIHRFEANAQSVPMRFFHYSSHAFSVAQAIELSRTLNQLPACLIVYGIEGKNFGAGVGLSPEVRDVMGEVLERIEEDLQTNWTR